MRLVFQRDDNDDRVPRVRKQDRGEMIKRQNSCLKIGFQENSPVFFSFMIFFFKVEKCRANTEAEVKGTLFTRESRNGGRSLKAGENSKWVERKQKNDDSINK